MSNLYKFTVHFLERILGESLMGSKPTYLNDFVYTKLLKKDKCLYLNAFHKYVLKLPEPFLAGRGNVNGIQKKNIFKIFSGKK